MFCFLLFFVVKIRVMEIIKCQACGSNDVIVRDDGLCICQYCFTKHYLNIRHREPDPAPKKEPEEAPKKESKAPKPEVKPDTTPKQDIEFFNVNGVVFKMVKVECGTFWMGSNDWGNDRTGAGRDERPVHSVTLDGFFMGETLVTQALWNAVMGTNPSFRKKLNLPVVQVNWFDCQQFTEKLSKFSGRPFRLPTEAEWEYAARGGWRKSGCDYAGSNVIDNVAWYEKNSDGRIHEVGQKQPNEMGLFDMSGNVWEWCGDWYGVYGNNAQTNPTGAKSGGYRVIRGGSWHGSAKNCRVSNRNRSNPRVRDEFSGFRLVLPL